MTSHHELRCHPDTPSVAVWSVHVDVTMSDENEVLLTFHVSPADSLELLPPMPPGRADDLWRCTCFEMFLKVDGGEDYREFNLSPSSQWAAYAFTGYRAGMRALELPVDPHIECERQGEVFVLEAAVDLAAVPAGRLRAGFSAVIEEAGGIKSYWALAHAPGRPDFHHEACFAIELPAPKRP